MAKVNITKPFVFSRPAKAGEKLPQEVRFRPGEQDIPDDIAAHPWIAKHFADGCIERPEQAKQRAADARAKAKKQREDADRALAQAEQAFARSQGNAAVVQAGAKATDKELNTPVNQLRVNQGSGVGGATAKNR
jgi:hypothetical protein